MARQVSRQGRSSKASKSPATLVGPAHSKFLLYDLAGRVRSRYLVDRLELTLQAAASPAEAVAHHILLIDRSASMKGDLNALKDNLVKLLTLDEYRNAHLLVSLLSYASAGDLQVHCERQPIQKVMKPGSTYLRAIKKMHTAAQTCISQALRRAQTLIQPGELTAITLHSDGYADDPSAAAEKRALDALAEELRKLDVFLNCIAYSDQADFRLLSRLANAVSGSCIRAGSAKEVYEALYHTAQVLAAGVVPPREESLPEGCDYQLLLSRRGRKVNGAAGPLRICCLKADDDAAIYRFRPVSEADYDSAQDHSAVQTSEPVYALARARLAEGRLNTARYALLSTLDETLNARHARALTNPEVAALAADLDQVLFDPSTLAQHTLRDRPPVNERLAVLPLVELLGRHKANLLVNRRHLQQTYVRRGVKRVAGQRDEQGRLVEPWLRAEPLGNPEYARVGSFDINHNAPVINMLLLQRVRLVRAADGTPVTEAGGVLLDDLTEFHSYTLVGDGEANVPELRVKVNSVQAFEALRGQGVLERDGVPATDYDFHTEYTIRLDNRPLVPLTGIPVNLDGVFEDLAEVRVLSGIVSASLRDEPDGYTPEQVEELKRHYLSRNLYLNFPSTTAYVDLQQALAEGTVDTRVSYRVDIGSREVLDLGDFLSANAFLDRLYQAFDQASGAKLEQKLTCDLTLDGNIRFQHRQPAERTALTRVEEFMKRIFDDYLGIEYNGSVAAILGRVGANGLRRVRQERRNGGSVGRDELVEALRVAQGHFRAYSEQVYRERVCPLVFYIGSTGLLPDEIEARAETAEELSSRYPHLHFSRAAQEGTFFEVGNTIISVYSQNEHFSREGPQEPEA